MIDSRRDWDDEGAGRDPVLRHESKEIIRKRVDDCIPLNATTYHNERALMMQEMPKPTAHKAGRIAFNIEQDRKQC